MYAVNSSDNDLSDPMDLDIEHSPPLRRSQRSHKLNQTSINLLVDDEDDEDEEDDEEYGKPIKRSQRSKVVSPIPMDIDEDQTVHLEADLEEPFSYMTLTPPSQYVVPSGLLRYHPSRDSRFPYLYEVPSHPLVNREAFGPGQTYITIRDTSKAAMLRLRNFEKNLKIPLGQDARMESQGLFELHAGDVIIVRNLATNKDHLEVFVCNYKSVLPNDPLVPQIMALNQDILGPAHLRTPNAPQKVGQEFLGGTKFERSGVEPVKPGTRCYTLGPTHQHPRNLTSPTSAGKVESDGTISDDVKLRQKIIKTVAGAATKVMNKVMPTKLQDQFQHHAEIMNAPRLGNIDNVYFSAMQMNIAPVSSSTNSENASLFPVLGFYGDGHSDKGDSAAGFTNMSCLSDFPLDQGYEDGRFHLLMYGIYAKSTPGSSLSFKGLYRHGGTPPLSPPAVPPLPSDYRLVVILYPNEAVLTPGGRHLLGFASLSHNQSLFSLTPEMTNPEPRTVKNYNLTNEANWAHDGQVLMDFQALFLFFVRGLLQICLFFCFQLPSAMKVEVNPDIFLSAFSFYDEETQKRVQATPWAAGPTGQSPEDDLVFLKELDASIQRNEEPQLPDNPTVAQRRLFLRHLYMREWNLAIDNARSLIPLEYHHPSASGLPTTLAPVSSKLGITQRTKPSTRRQGKPRKNPDISIETLHPFAIAASSSTLSARNIERTHFDQPLFENSSHLLTHAQEVHDFITDAIDQPDPLWNHRLEDYMMSSGDESGGKNALYDTDKEEGREEEQGEEEEEEVNKRNNGSDGNTDNEDEDEDMVEQGYDEEDEELLESEHPLNTFCDQLEGLAIGAAIDEFQHAARTLDADAYISADIVQTARSVTVILELLLDPDESKSQLAAERLPLIWPSIDTFCQQLNVRQAEQRYGHALIMQATLAPHIWLENLVDSALDVIQSQSKLPTSYNWIEHLVSDVDIICKQGQFSTHLSVDPRKYGLMGEKWKCTISQSYKNSHYDTQENTKAALKHWLNFPLSDIDLERTSFLLLIHRLHISTSIFLLDCVWDVFQSPALLADSTHRIAGSRTVNHALKSLAKKLAHHPLLDSTSPTAQSLQLLDKVFLSWENIQKGFASSHLDHTPVLGWGAGPSIFCEYIRKMLPIARDGPDAHKKSMDPQVAKVAHDADYLSPLRDTAPTRCHLQKHLFSDPTFLKTDDGFGSVLLHRALFYGSPFALKDDGIWPKVNPSWDDIQKEHNYNKAYFVRNNVYGSGNRHRKLENFTPIWDGRFGWHTFLEDNLNPNFDQASTILAVILVVQWIINKKITNVGPLTAVLIAGDLADAGVIPEPTPEMMGKLIFDLSKGAMVGLRYLKLIVGSHPSQQDVQRAMVILYNHLKANLTDEEQQIIKFSVRMIEHGLCKIQRLERLFNPSSRKKARKTRKGNKRTGRGGGKLAHQKSRLGAQSSNTVPTIETIRLGYYTLGQQVRGTVQTQVGDREQIEQRCESVNRFISVLAEHQLLFTSNELHDLNEGLTNMCDALNHAATTSGDSGNAQQVNAVYRVYTGRPGRPRTHIANNILSEALQLRGPTHLGPVFDCSPRTVRRRALEDGLVEPCPPVYISYEDEETGEMLRFYQSSTAPMSQLTDDALDLVMRHILEIFPSFGRRMITGQILEMGHRVSRARIRASYERVMGAPAGLNVRLVGRRTYSVPGPNSLWHHDGQHGLIKYRIVIHAFVDGYSRMVTAIQASDNNQAETVLNLFHQGRAVFGTPSRVRGDHGVENLRVAEFMESNFGSERGSYIWGRSVHNIRIERLWRDITRHWGSKWKNFFLDLEANNELDITEDAQIWLLHTLFLPQINDDAATWARGWNSHNVRINGQRERSPSDMFFFGQLEHGIRDLEIEANDIDVLEQEEIALFGVDWEDMEENDILRHHSNNNAELVDLDVPSIHTRQPRHMSSVEVPFTNSPFTEEEEEIFAESVVLIPEFSSHRMNDRKISSI
ncbi:hypothetical protein H0H93_012214 [Arthromyces matolae]|nr:hypothetical protein H0H93_012214 [Arthromyces matolae]